MAKMNHAGTLPDMPDVRPSLSSFTGKPRFCKIASADISLCNSGVLFAFGP